MAKEKLNNLLDFKKFDKLCKLENKPGKTFEQKVNNLLALKDKNLKSYKKKTKQTEIGGDVLNENVEALHLIAAVVNDAAFMNKLKTFVNMLSPKVKETLYKLLKD